MSQVMDNVIGSGSPTYDNAFWEISWIRTYLINPAPSPQTTTARPAQEPIAFPAQSTSGASSSWHTAVYLPYTTLLVSFHFLSLWNGYLYDLVVYLLARFIYCRFRCLCHREMSRTSRTSRIHNLVLMGFGCDIVWAVSCSPNSAGIHIYITRAVETPSRSCWILNWNMKNISVQIDVVPAALLLFNL